MHASCRTACLLRCRLQQPASGSIASLHEAAKWGDLEAGRRLLDAGEDVSGLVRVRLCGGAAGGLGGDSIPVCMHRGLAAERQQLHSRGWGATGASVGSSSQPQ
jgi:hypothetical protein